MPQARWWSLKAQPEGYIVVRRAPRQQRIILEQNADFG